MKILLVLLTIPLWPADLNPKILNLVGPHAHTVFGQNIERHQQSALGTFFPVLDSSRQSLSIKYFDPADSRESELFLSIREGAITPPLEADSPERVLDSYTTMRGESSVLDEAAMLWLREDARPAPLAYRVQQLAGMYDNWFVMLKPLNFAAGERGPSGPWPLKYRKDMVEMIEEVSGGIRFGTNIECRVQAVMRSADDAKALAALAKWLPGLIQLMPSSSPMAPLVDLAENISTTTDGRVVTLSFQLPEEKVRELAGRLRELNRVAVQ